MKKGTFDILGFLVLLPTVSWLTWQLLEHEKEFPRFLQNVNQHFTMLIQNNSQQLAVSVCWLISLAALWFSYKSVKRVLQHLKCGGS